MRVFRGDMSSDGEEGSEKESRPGGRGAANGIIAAVHWFLPAFEEALKSNDRKIMLILIPFAPRRRMYASLLFSSC